jgi:catechol 2,3-dioxygenase-like lactoylglutathione lyase family enzyme
MKRAVFKRTRPYKEDEMNLPVSNIDEAIPYYVEKLGFRVAARGDAPVRSVTLARDDIRIGLAENGGDSSQDGCFFEVDDIDAAFEELHGNNVGPGAIEVQTFGARSLRVFFVVAPDGLCYMLGQPVL